MIYILSLTLALAGFVLVSAGLNLGWLLLVAAAPTFGLAMAWEMIR